MNHRDAEVADIVVCLTAAYADRLDEAIARLKQTGMDVFSADDSNSVVEGVIDTDRLGELNKLDCVSYVRTVFVYVADYPPGDPRDRDGVLREH